MTLYLIGQSLIKAIRRCNLNSSQRGILKGESRDGEEMILQVINLMELRNLRRMQMVNFGWDIVANVMYQTFMMILV